MSRYHSKSQAAVYFIQCGANGPIKIGIAHDPYLRLSELQVGNWQELFLRGIYPEQGKRGEKRIHALFARYHIRGEWFEASQELLDYVRNVSLRPKTPGIKFGRPYGWDHVPTEEEAAADK